MTWINGMEVMPVTMEFILLLLRMLLGMDTPLTSSAVLELIPTKYDLYIVLFFFFYLLAAMYGK